MLKLSNTTCLSASARPQFHFRGMKVERKLAADASNHPHPWKLYPLLQSTIISSVIDTSRTLVSFKAEEKVGSAIKKLTDYNVLSGMVFEMRGRPIGFLDVLDIMTDLTHSANVSDSKRSVQEKIELLKSSAPKFLDQECETLMNASKRDPFIVHPADNTVFEAIQDLTKVHRVAVADVNRWAVFTQSDVAKFVMKTINVAASPMHSSIQDVGITPSKPGSIDEHVSVASAMRFMRDSKLSGVAVLDKHNKILTNFSATDLLGITENKFPYLMLPVFEYLNKMRGHNVPPVTCRMDDTVETLLYKMVFNRVHRIYVVDDHNKPTGVITLSDIMKFFSKITD